MEQTSHTPPAPSRQRPRTSAGSSSDQQRVTPNSGTGRPRLGPFSRAIDRGGVGWSIDGRSREGRFLRAYERRPGRTSWRIGVERAAGDDPALCSSGAASRIDGRTPDDWRTAERSRVPTLSCLERFADAGLAPARLEGGGRARRAQLERDHWHALKGVAFSGTRVPERNAPARAPKDAVPGARGRMDDHPIPLHHNHREPSCQPPGSQPTRARARRRNQDQREQPACAARRERCVGCDRHPADERVELNALASDDLVARRS